MIGQEFARGRIRNNSSTQGRANLGAIALLIQLPDAGYTEDRVTGVSFPGAAAGIQYVHSRRGKEGREHAATAAYRCVVVPLLTKPRGSEYEGF